MKRTSDGRGVGGPEIVDGEQFFIVSGYKVLVVINQYGKIITLRTFSRGTD